MATLVDVINLFKALGLYETVFPGILVFALVYGLLFKFQPFGESKLINSVVALVVALIFVSFINAVAFITFLIPLITAMFVVLLLVLLIFMFMGVPGETVKEAMLTPQAYAFIIILVVIFVFLALAAAFPELTVEEAVAEEAAPSAVAFAKFSQLFFHPVVLGLIVLLAVFAVASYFITREEVKKG